MQSLFDKNLRPVWQMGKPLLLTVLIVSQLTACQTLKNIFAPKTAEQMLSEPLQNSPFGKHTLSTPDTLSSPKPLDNPTAQEPTALPTPQTTTPPSFAITGKIGVTSVLADGKRQAGSAFYAWGQENERFAIDLTGALGLGATTIRYDGKKAVLMSEKTGELVADSPEALLYQATGWYAPISHLPFWVMGQFAPSDDPSHSEQDAHDKRPIKAVNGEWQALFEYQKKSTPQRIIMTHQDGHRVVLTINQ